MAWALIGPIPGRASSVSALAVLMLTFSPGASLADLLSIPEGVFEAVDDLYRLLCSRRSLGGRCGD